MVVAKATYLFDPQGRTKLDDQDPIPLLHNDEPTEVGLLPRDDFPRQERAFEVIFLGCAHAPNQIPVQSLRVVLGLGDAWSELLVHGDRSWLRRGPATSISPAQPFVRMPMGWDHAFGGSAEILIDEGAVLEVGDPHNRIGKGFDPEPSARAAAAELRAPAPFPLFSPERALPNIERPNLQISRWSDAPPPASWATVPLDSALQALRTFDLPADHTMPEDIQAALSPSRWFRAVPEWILPIPPAGAMIYMENLYRWGAQVRVPLPQLRVFADYQVGERAGELELEPQMLVLMPEQSRFCLVYRKIFNFSDADDIERSMRLRKADGWFSANDQGQESKR
ncbi:hypothetical protein ENSA5_58470 [Enhygromyxa salina]|uniref:DUF2169 domain-containing protein n=2 Tax=Enhygromyxa salina TaxID=215803 RepID=A0A2S9XED5_9BACT|nr:hypothetical protein ENSA5_58470 [Enhygromyxa salina]